MTELFAPLAPQLRANVVPACLPDEYLGTNLTSVLTKPHPTVLGWGATFVGGGTVSR